MVSASRRVVSSPDGEGPDHGSLNTDHWFVLAPNLHQALRTASTRGVFMIRTTAVMLSLAMLGAAHAGGRQAWPHDRQDRRDRRAIAREQGVPPGQLPPANLCRVWYDNRPNGQQPAATYCREAELIASRNRNARVIYGENVYCRVSRSLSGDRPSIAIAASTGCQAAIAIPPAIACATPRPGSRTGIATAWTRDARMATITTASTPHVTSWYRSATRGYENEYGSRSSYQTMYREGFEAGYADGYRAADRW